jgi:hypothetical protein
MDESSFFFFPTVKIFKRIATLRGLITVEVLESVNVNANQPFAVVPGCSDLILKPLAPRRVLANQYDIAGFAVELIIDPFLDGFVATLCDCFPVIVRRGLIAFDYAHVSDAGSARTIRFVVKGVKNSSRHSGEFLLRHTTIELFEPR